MSSQESRCGLKVLLFDGWPNNYSITSDVRSEAPQGDRPASGVQNPGSNLDRQHGFELYQRQSRYDALRTPLIENPFYIIRAALLVVELRQSARIDEVARHSAFFSGCNHCIRKRSRDGCQSLSNFVKTNIIVFCRFPFFGLEISGHVGGCRGNVGDRYEQALPI